MPIFFTKIAITQPRMIQIPKFWCLKSCTNIWLHFGNIHSIQKINRIELEGKKGSKFAKIGQFFTLQKIKIEFSQKFPKVWFHGFFLWLTNILEKLISLTDLMGRVKCLGQSCRALWIAKNERLNYGRNDTRGRLLQSVWQYLNWLGNSFKLLPLSRIFVNWQQLLRTKECSHLFSSRLQ